MKARIFLYMNILVYLLDADDPAKQRRVQDLPSNRELRTRLILETALAAGATFLYSEDFQDGSVFGRLRIVNPFKVSV